jgi:diguanylate cyclase (GGDEF)-like protein
MDKGPSSASFLEQADRGLEPRGQLLIFEDDPDYRENLIRHLRDAGHEVVVARDGEEAWRKLRQSPPELVLSDWMMPELTGMELCRRIKEDRPLQSIYFLLLTANDQLEDKVAALNGGVDDYVAKSCPEAELLARVRTGLRLHRSQARLETDAMVDSRTGLRNRRYFDLRLEQEVSLSRRHDTPLSLVLIDLDRPRQISEQDRHPSVDVLLLVVSQAIQDRVRGTDLAARLDGSAFAVILPHTGLEGAKVLARDLEHAFGNIRIELDTGALCCAGSVGCAGLEEEMDARDLYRAANAALHDRKYERREMLFGV